MVQGGGRGLVLLLSCILLFTAAALVQGGRVPKEHTTSFEERGEWIEVSKADASYPLRVIIALTQRNKDVLGMNCIHLNE